MTTIGLVGLVVVSLAVGFAAGVAWKAWRYRANRLQRCREAAARLDSYFGFGSQEQVER